MFPEATKRVATSGISVQPKVHVRCDSHLLDYPVHRGICKLHRRPRRWMLQHSAVGRDDGRRRGCGTVGVLTDMARYAQAEDPVEWEVFRTGVLECQGWVLHRVWTPHFFRDMEVGTQAIAREAGAFLASGESGDGVRVAAGP